MKKNLFYFSSLIIACAVFGLTSCQKDTTDSKTTTTTKDRANINRTVNYTVLVVAGEATLTSSEKSAKGATGASVTVSVAGAVVNKTTDASGQATFAGLTAGRAAVTVKLADHTTANFTVDLFHTDTIDYDNQSLREAATKVILLPTTGTGMVTVSGIVYLQSNIKVKFLPWSVGNSAYTQSPEFELAPVGTIVTATVSSSSLNNLVTNLKGGAVTNITLENCSFTGTVGPDGSYSVSIPTTSNGVSSTISASSLAVNVSYSANTVNSDGTYSADIDGNYNLTDKTQRIIFPSTSSSVDGITNKNIIEDIYYSVSPITITDPYYYGNSDYSAL